MSNVTNARQCFTAKTVGSNALQILKMVQLRGGKTFADYRKIGFSYARAVVLDLFPLIIQTTRMIKYNYFNFLKLDVEPEVI